MVSDKRVQNLAKDLAKLIGNIDKHVTELELKNTQEASNQAFEKEISKKITKNINI